MNHRETGSKSISVFVASETIRISHVVAGSFGEGRYSALVVLDV